MLHHDRTEIHFKPNPFQVSGTPTEYYSKKTTYTYSISDQL